MFAGFESDVVEPDFDAGERRPGIVGDAARDRRRGKGRIRTIAISVRRRIERIQRSGAQNRLLRSRRDTSPAATSSEPSDLSHRRRSWPRRCWYADPFGFLRVRFVAGTSAGNRHMQCQVEDFAFEHDSIRGGESMGFQSLVDDLESPGDGHIGPADIAAGVDVDFCRGTAIGIAGLGRVKAGRQRAKVFPVLGLPYHENPVDLRVDFLRRLAIGVEPEAMPDAVMHDDPLRFHVECGERGQDGAQVQGVAATFGVPLSAAERGAFPPGDAALVVKDRRRALGPSRVVDRFIAFATGDERERRRRDQSRDRNGEQGRGGLRERFDDIDSTSIAA